MALFILAPEWAGGSLDSCLFSALFMRVRRDFAVAVERLPPSRAIRAGIRDLVQRMAGPFVAPLIARPPSRPRRSCGSEDALSMLAAEYAGASFGSFVC